MPADTMAQQISWQKQQQKEPDSYESFYTEQRKVEYQTYATEYVTPVAEEGRKGMEEVGVKIVEAVSETRKTVEAPFIKLGEAFEETQKWAGRVGGWWSDAYHSTLDAFSETQKFFGGIADFWSGWKGIVVVLVVVVFLMLLLGVGIKTS